MGNGIAHAFAQYGYSVSLYDVSAISLEKASDTIEKNLDRQVNKNTITADDKINILQRIEFINNIHRAANNCELLIEAVSENWEIKKKVFIEFDKIGNEHAILASNTSSISITKLASVTQRPDKVIGMHFMNPVPVMKLVEVIKGFNTSEDTVKKILEVSAALKKVPVLVNDLPGFISNRILMPMINEAIYSLYENVAGVEEIDTIMKLGMNHPMGPLQLADFIGLDVCQNILQVLYNGFGNTKYAPCPLLNNMVEAGHLGVKSGAGFYRYEKGAKIVGTSERFL
ncbi:MAG TPA: 3-hydroxyacyl-CoA dehydrogenase NAD-binding domain-containing protein [Cytophagaceae bacterium]